MRHHGTLRFTPAHMKSVLVETWEYLKLSSAKITQKYFKKKHLLPLSPPYIGTNHQACLAGNQHSNRDKTDEIGCIANTSVSPIEMEEVRTTDPTVILRYKGRCRASIDLLIRVAAYDILRAINFLPLHQIKKF